METAKEDREILLSIIVPFYNEELNIQPLYQRLKNTLNDLTQSYELVFINDGSTDSTAEILESLFHDDPRISVIQLKGNYGQTPALSAGFDHARGKIIIPMDGDLQHAPEDIPRFLMKLAEGYDVVSGFREKRKDPLFSRRIPSKVANWLMKKLSGIDITDFGTTFKAYRREIVKDLRLYGEFHRFIPVLLKDKRVRITEIPITNIRRIKGKSNYNISRTFTVFFDLIRINFLSKYLSRPLQFFGSLGLILGFIGFIIVSYLIYLKYFYGLGLLEYRAPLFLLSILFMIIGTQFLTLGLLGELIVKLYYSSGEKKIYNIEKVLQKPVQGKLRKDAKKMKNLMEILT